MDEQHIPVYQIDNGIPVPKATAILALLKSLEVGESFLFPVRKRASAQTYTSDLKRSTGKKFTIKKMDAENCRVWRTE